MVTVISNARVFDGERVLDEQTVVVDRQRIDTIGGGTPAGATVVDARGGTLLPGLIDAHTHTSLDSLRFALAFGVTTELEMQGHWTAQERREVAERDDVADVRSAGLSITPPGGHPSEIVPAQVNSRPGEEEQPFPFTTGPEHAAEIIAERAAGGSDYIKIMVEDGTVFGHPDLPYISDEVLTTAVKEAHRHRLMAITHAFTLDATRRSIDAGVDGLAHLFIDRPHTPAIVAAVAASGAFVTPTLVSMGPLTLMRKPGLYVALKRDGALVPGQTITVTALGGLWSTTITDGGPSDRTYDGAQDPADGTFHLRLPVTSQYSVCATTSPQWGWEADCVGVGAQLYFIEYAATLTYQQKWYVPKF